MRLDGDARVARSHRMHGVKSFGNIFKEQVLFNFEFVKIKAAKGQVANIKQISLAQLVVVDHPFSHINYFFYSCLMRSYK